MRMNSTTRPSSYPGSSFPLTSGREASDPDLSPQTSRFWLNCACLAFKRLIMTQRTSWCFTSGHFYCFPNQSKSILQRNFRESLVSSSQSELKPKPIVTRSRTFSRALCQLHVFASSFDWFTGLSVSFVIGQINYFGFGFTTLN